MPVVPSIRTVARTPPPLDWVAEITLDDAVDMLMHRRREAHARFRRTVLILGVPVVWFLTLLGLFASWHSEPGTKSAAAFLRDMVGVSLAPVVVFLTAVSAATVLVYLAIPAFLRRAARNEMNPSYGRPIAVRYRLGPAGITISEPLRSVVVPWSWLSPLQSTDRILYLPLHEQRDAVLFPRQSLSGEAVVSLRCWCKTRIGPEEWSGEAADPFPGPVIEDGAVRLTFELTAADYAAIAGREEQLRATRIVRYGAFAILFVLLSLVWPAAYAFAWIVDPYRVPIGLTLPLYLEMFGAVFWKPAAVFAVLIGLALVTNRFLADSYTRNLGGQRYAAARTGGVRVAFDAAGIHGETVENGGRDWLSWNFVEGIERSETHVFLRLKRGRVITLPLGAFEGDSLSRFDALVAEHLPPSGGTAP